MNARSGNARVNSKLIALWVVALVAAVLTAPSLAGTEAFGAGNSPQGGHDDYSEYTFAFSDGTVMTGSNQQGRPGYTGSSNEADLGLSDWVHVSCSDGFGFDDPGEPDGWGEKGSPVQGVDPYPIVWYSIDKYKGGSLDKTCGNQPPPEPDIDLEKYVSVEGPSGPWDDADSRTGPEAIAGEDVYFKLVVTNTGEVGFTELSLTDTDFQDLIDAQCTIPASLAPTASFDCVIGPVTAAAGQHRNVATVVGRYGEDVGPFPHAYTGYKHAFTFHFGDDSIIEGTSDGNEPDVGLSEPIHVSCSDPFPGGWGKKGAPVQGVDPSPIAHYFITKFKSNGEIDKTCGEDFSGGEATDRDPAHYFGLVPAIDIEKMTNGQQADGADDADVPEIKAGNKVRWTYKVKNTGEVPFALAGVTVTDDQGVSPAFDPGSDSGSDSMLDPGETWVYRAEGEALDLETAAGVTIVEGCGDDRSTYENVGIVEATARNTAVTDEDPSHYCNPPVIFTINLDIETFTVRGAGTLREAEFQADRPTGPAIAVNQRVVWRYKVRNTGTGPASNVQVTDTILKPGSPTQPAVTPLYKSGDANGDGLLDPGELWIYEAEGTAWNPGPCPNRGCPTSPVWGQYENLGTVTGDDPQGVADSDTDPTCYFAAYLDGIKIQKSTNGKDSDTAPGEDILTGNAVRWRYRVHNGGTVPLKDVSVTDSEEGMISGPGCVLGDGVTFRGDKDRDCVLDPGEAWVFRLVGKAETGPYANLATITGVPIDPEPPHDELLPPGETVGDEDWSHYNGTGGGIDIEKYTVRTRADAQQAFQATSAKGPFIPVGQPVMWWYVVKNRSTVALDNVVVTDEMTYIFPNPDDYPDLEAPPSVTPVFMGVCQDTPCDPDHLRPDTNGMLDPDEVWLYMAEGTAWNPGPCPSNDKRVGCPQDPDRPNGVWGQYENKATVTATDPFGETLTDEDYSCYFAAFLNGTGIEMSTNSKDADNESMAPTLRVGKTVRWRYRVHNAGNVPLKDVTVTDVDADGNTRTLQGPSCVGAYDPGNLINRSDKNKNCLLDPGEAWIYKLVGIVEPGLHAYTATIVGTPIDPYPPHGVLADPVTDDDPSCYIGRERAPR